MAKRLMAAALAAIVLATASFAAETLSEVTIPNGLAHAKLGDWITFKMADGTQQRHTVIERTGDTPTSEIVVRIETLVNNQPQDVKRFRQNVGEEFVKPPVPYGETHTYRRRQESITFEGTLLEITILDIMNNGTLVRTWYLSTELPVYGVIKKTFANGSSEFEVVDFGFGDGNISPY